MCHCRSMLSRICAPQGMKKEYSEQVRLVAGRLIFRNRHLLLMGLFCWLEFVEHHLGTTDSSDVALFE